MLRLLPVSQREEFGRSLDPLPWEPPRKHPAGNHLAPADLWKSFLRGGYPELVAGPDRDISLWHSSYVQTYLERDVSSLRKVWDLISFQSFLRALAARAGQLLNLTDLSRDLGVAVNTAKRGFPSWRPRSRSSCCGRTMPTLANAWSKRQRCTSRTQACFVTWPV